jgi:hypothetical protein
MGEVGDEGDMAAAAAAEITTTVATIRQVWERPTRAAVRTTLRLIRQHPVAGALEGADEGITAHQAEADITTMAEVEEGITLEGIPLVEWAEGQHTTLSLELLHDRHMPHHPIPTVREPTERQTRVPRTGINQDSVDRDRMHRRQTPSTRMAAMLLLSIPTVLRQTRMPAQVVGMDLEVAEALRAIVVETMAGMGTVAAAGRVSSCRLISCVERFTDLEVHRVGRITDYLFLRSATRCAMRDVSNVSSIYAGIPSR